MLELTDVGLLLDTGHLALGGGDPVQGLRDWHERIDHVHVKDYRRSILDSASIADAAGMEEAWRRKVFCELGTGDVDLARVLLGAQVKRLWRLARRRAGSDSRRRRGRIRGDRRASSGTAAGSRTSSESRA